MLQIDCQDVNTHVISVKEESTIQLYGTAVYECQQRLIGAQEDTAERLAAGRRLGMVGDVNRGWEKLLQSLGLMIQDEGSRVVRTSSDGSQA